MNSQVPVLGKRPGTLRIGGGPVWLGWLFKGWMHVVLDRIDGGIDRGSIDVTLPDGRQRRLGGRDPGFAAEIELIDWHALLRLVTAGSVGWYRAWELGEWRSPDPVTLFAAYMDNVEGMGRAARANGPWRYAMRAAQKLRRNTRGGALRNTRDHHDLGNDFYAAWLDPTMTTSGARFAGEVPAGESGAVLAAAQQRKHAGIIARIGGARTVLDIGCGFGALAGDMARAGMDVTAIGISEQQLRWAATHQPGRIDFQRCDWRDVTGQYDAVTCIEVIETVGRARWPLFFEQIRRLLKPGGRAVLQFVTMREDLFNYYANSADFVQTCVRPGEMLAGVQELERLAVLHRLDWMDEVRFGADYAETLRLWRARFDGAVTEGRIPPGFDARFLGLWRYFLMYSEGGFRGGGVDVVQVTLVKG